MIGTRWTSALARKLRGRASPPTSRQYTLVGPTLEHTLAGGTPENLAVRVDVLKTLLERSDTEAMHVAGIRQRLLNYSLLIFGAVVAFSNGRGTGSTGSGAGTFDRKFAAVALVALMLVFCYLDRHYHRISHGWRRTSSRLIKSLVALVNDPHTAVRFQRYSTEGEQAAEPFYKSGQPIITWLLVVGSIVNLCRSFGWLGN